MDDIALRDLADTEAMNLVFGIPTYKIDGEYCFSFTVFNDHEVQKRFKKYVKARKKYWRE